MEREGGGRDNMDSLPGRVSSSPPPLYSVLGVPVNVSQAELARQFKRLSLKLHPDRVAYRKDTETTNEVQVQQRYQRITEAYMILSDPERRAAYDTRHSVNFSSRVTALREALERNEASVAPVAKRHCSESASGAEGRGMSESSSRNKNKSSGDTDNSGEDEDEEAEYIPE
ncbi:hypothetical protein BCY84_15782 [Trypanosoma cruzi cruzi]|uniref:J domain-containing protein n=1 Tax=Trypanosoma cruzi TaxID=5693 RepID=A0A2V2VW95_TRYCR|nr:hypothetical protein BCY84_15782 [Trypanosoma cruzi cruzi]PWU84128.1 hypothetical protein C4B63_253g13 [Trypanosoma cruzi]PWV00660.1 hypothetical protein C4B63_6g144 [Trypanosoma cruzi]